ncbi:hypothetical protein [Methylobacterium sp. E-046]|uniref:hypothetical protein n=1 Tax=Methylobacterium sp. E-046 TaxID=2836576 RepID=UPI001FB8936A|nr:hypothetical protein [Methylobacterium sp. E-046]MCJ2098923.1 hypothetical protein [Methylobacterium sp. E-046]
MPSRALSRWLLILALAVIACVLAGGAWAQATEAAQAAAKAGDWYLTQGVLGTTCVVLLLTVGFLFWKLDRLSTSIMREVITALQANTAATAAGTVTISALKTTLDATDDGVEKLSHQTSLAAQAAASRGDEILGNQRNVLARIEVMQASFGKLDGIKDGVDELRRRL